MNTISGFGMDTITLAGSLEAKLAAMKAAGFSQVMLMARDLVTHPGGVPAAVQAVRESGLRPTGFQVLRDFEGAMHYLECVGSDAIVCAIQPGCGLKNVLAEAERLQWEYLDTVMLASVVRPGQDLVQLTKAAPNAL